MDSCTTRSASPGGAAAARSGADSDAQNVLKPCTLPAGDLRQASEAACKLPRPGWLCLGRPAGVGPVRLWRDSPSPGSPHSISAPTTPGQAAQRTPASISECGSPQPQTCPQGGGRLATRTAACCAASRLGLLPAGQLHNAGSFVSAGSSAASDAEVEVAAWNWADLPQRAFAQAAVDTLVEAMADDPVNAYLAGGRPSASFARREIEGYVRALPRAAHFLATHDAAAVALWQLLPQEAPRNEALAGWTRIFQTPPRMWPSLLALELCYEAAHARTAAAWGSPYYYLSFVGTRPAARRRGLASLLVRAVTGRADAEGWPCMLEATSDRSRALYERHGFAVTEVYRLAPGAPPVFFMARACRPTPATWHLPPPPAEAAPAADEEDQAAAAAAALIATLAAKRAAEPALIAGGTGGSLIAAGAASDEGGLVSSCEAGVDRPLGA